MINKLIPVVIWFNPDESSVENIIKYNSLFKNIIIIDNSNSDNSSLSEKILNSIYIPNNKNLGIAEALNIGCKKAMELNYDYVMTMDQDSSWNIEILKKYIDECEQHKTDEIKSFAPNHTNQKKSVIGHIKYYLKKEPVSDLSYPDKVMTSGNIFYLDLLNELGFFNKDLFIDEVDHEFCYRIINSGKKILMFNKILMEHTLGNVKRSFLPKPCKHNGVRLYYIFRNILYIKSNYPEFYKKNGYKKYVLFSILQKTFEFNINDIKYIIRGIKDYHHNIYGEYKV